MGAATSYQSGKIINKAVDNVSTETIQNSITNSSQHVNINATNVGGNVEISGNNISQTIDLSMKSIFDSLSQTSVSDKVNSEIEQITRHTLSGLNLAQVSASAETFEHVVQNLIKIKNVGVNNCKNNSTQTIKLVAKNVDGSFLLTNNDIVQSTQAISECILSSESNAALIKDTDTKLKQLTVETVKGLDPTIIAAAIIGAVGVFAFGGMNSMKTFLGPGLIAAGGAVLYFKYYKNPDATNEKETSETFIFYNEKFADEYVTGLSRVSKGRGNGDEDTNKTYDVIEFYDHTFLKYKTQTPKTDLVNALKAIKMDELGEKSFEISKEPITNFVSIKFTESTEKFSPMTLDLKLTETSTIGHSSDKTNPTFVWDYDNKKHTLNFYKGHKAGSPINSLKLSPSVIRILNANKKDDQIDLMFYLGAGLIAVGVLLTFVGGNFESGKQKSAF